MGTKVFLGWRVVIGSGVGIAFGSAVFLASSFALLSSAIGSQFGWSQTELAKAASLFLLFQMLTYPICGWALDKWGSFKVATASIALFALALFLLSQMTNSLTQFYLVFVFMGLVTSGTNVISYARAITLWFNRRRGIALGVAAGFQAVGAFTMPLMMQKIIASSGWVTAVLALACIELLICLPLVALLVKNSPEPFGLLPDGDLASSVAVPAQSKDNGAVITFRDLMCTPTFWKLAISFAIMGLSFYGVVTNNVFILTESAGLSLSQVAQLAATTGVMVLFGRIGFGYLLDRIHAPKIGVMTLAFAAVWCCIYAMATSYGVIVLGAIAAGLSIGGESDLMPYLAGRYFGAQAVSKVFGWFLCAFYVGAAIGPVAFAQASKALGGASIPLYAIAALQIIPALLFLSLGAYKKE